MVVVYIYWTSVLGATCCRKKYGGRVKYIVFDTPQVVKCFKVESDAATECILGTASKGVKSEHQNCFCLFLIFSYYSFLRIN